MSRVFLLIVAICLKAIPALGQAEIKPPDWIGEAFFSCHDTPFHALGSCGGIWCASADTSATAYPLSPFRVAAARVSGRTEKSASLELLLDGTGFQRVLVIDWVPFENFDRKSFAQIVFPYLRGVREIPPTWSAEQKDAIQNERIIPGMDRQQVLCAIGPPERENDYGDGLIQEIYKNGALLVYWNPNGLVQDVQAFR